MWSPNHVKHQPTRRRRRPPIWGMPAIAAYIGRTTRGAYYLAESGNLPGCRKLGGCWCMCPDTFDAAFAEAHAESEVA
jgi:hypothetical protein